MRRFIISTALLLCTVTAVAAQVPAQNTYKDLIRPHGQMRSDAVHQADVESCYQQTGANRYLPDNAAMKKCMAGRGYRFVSQSRGTAGRRTSHNPEPDYTPPPDSTPVYAPQPPAPPIIDPTTGMAIPGTGG